jgi:hypothetical protein
MAQWRRWAFFERRDDGWRSMVPYESAELLEAIIDETDIDKRRTRCDELRTRVLSAISAAEGIRHESITRKHLALRVTRVRDGSVRGYRLFAVDSFAVRVAEPVGLVNYLEYAPDAVELVSEEGAGVARLRISLDLLEMLELIRNGYRPTANELQGLFVNLLIFRNELLATTFARVLLTHDDQTFYEVSGKGDNEGIHLRIAPRTGDQAEGGVAP